MKPWTLKNRIYITSKNWFHKIRFDFNNKLITIFAIITIISILKLFTQQISYYSAFNFTSNARGDHAPYLIISFINYHSKKRRYGLIYIQEHKRLLNITTKKKPKSGIHCYKYKMVSYPLQDLHYGTISSIQLMFT